MQIQKGFNLPHRTLMSNVVSTVDKLTGDTGFKKLWMVNVVDEQKGEVELLCFKKGTKVAMNGVKIKVLEKVPFGRPIVQVNFELSIRGVFSPLYAKNIMADFDHLCELFDKEVASLPHLKTAHEQRALAPEYAQNS